MDWQKKARSGLERLERWTAYPGVVEGVLLALTLPYLWMLWSVEFPIMQDFPGHLELGYLHHLVQSGDPAAAGIYEVRDQPWPNSLGTTLLGWLGPMFGFLNTGKLLLSLYLLAWPLSVSLVARALGRSPWLALLAIPAALDYNWGMGFFNYLLSKPLLMFSLYIAIRFARHTPTPEERNAKFWRRRHLHWGLALSASLALTYLGHALVWLFTMFLCGLAVLMLSSGWKRVLNQVALLVVCPIVIPYVSWEAGDRDFGREGYDWHEPDRGFLWTWDFLGRLNSGNSEELAYGLCFAAWLIMMSRQALLPDPTRQSGVRHATGFVLVSIFVIVLTYWYGPQHIPKVAIICMRQVVFAWTLLLLLPIIHDTLLNRSLLFASAIVAVSIHAQGMQWHYQQFSQKQMGTFSTLLNHIEPGSKIVAQYLEPHSIYGTSLTHRAFWHWPKLAHVRAGTRTADSFAFNHTAYVSLTQAAYERGMTDRMPYDHRTESWLVEGGWDYLLIQGPSELVLQAAAGAVDYKVGETGEWQLYRLISSPHMLPTYQWPWPPDLIGSNKGTRHTRWNCLEQDRLTGLKLWRHEHVGPITGISVQCQTERGERAWGSVLGSGNTTQEIDCPSNTFPTGISVLSTDDALQDIRLFCEGTLSAITPKTKRIRCPDYRPRLSGIEARIHEGHVEAVGLLCTSDHPNP